IEIRAEASRNPTIRKLVQECDEEVAAELRIIIAAAIGRKLAKADLEARVEMFLVIFQGIGLRTVVNAKIDRRSQSQLVVLAIDAILKP
ncbi:MAG: TetR family transcriptional regulator C-terminal domain-containing protein, partial [Gammaproteobacteria bacterium]